MGPLALGLLMAATELGSGGPPRPPRPTPRPAVPHPVTPGAEPVFVASARPRIEWANSRSPTGPRRPEPPFLVMPIAGACDLTDELASKLLEEAGYFTDLIASRFGPPRRSPAALTRDERYRAALRVVFVSFTIGVAGVRFPKEIELDTPVPVSGPLGVDTYLMRDLLFDELRLLAAAQRKYRDLPDLDRESAAQLYARWVDRAAAELPEAMPLEARRAVVDEVVTRESQGVHWAGFRPKTHAAGEVGFGQLLAGNTRVYSGVNHYDPEENLRGLARDLHRWMPRGDWKKLLPRTLARYNGGAVPPARSWNNYAAPIMRQLRNRDVGVD